MTNETEEKIDLNDGVIHYQSIKKSKYIWAKVLDFLFFIVVSLIVTFGTISIAVVTPGFSNILNRAEDIQLKSHLYIKDKKDAVKLSTFLKNDKEMPTDEKNTKLDEALTYFYSSDLFFKDGKGIEKYNSYKLNAKDKESRRLFKEDLTINAEAGIYPEVYFDFYSDILVNKACPALQNNKTYHHLSLVTTRIFIIIGVTMPVLSYAGLFILVPALSFRNHNTPGMKICKIGVIDGNDGLSLKPKKVALYLTFNSLIVILLSLGTFFVPLIISMGMFLYREDNKNLTNYVINCYVVSYENSKIFKSEEEFIKTTEYFESHSELFENTPLEVENKESKEQ